MKCFLAIGVLLLCLLTSQIARADEKRNAQIKAEMVENYLLWQEAYKNKDAGRIISFESPDFTTVFDKRVSPKYVVDNALRDLMESTQKVNEAHVEIKKLTIESNRVVILRNQILDVDVQNPKERLSITFHSRDIWVLYSP